jgi:hypothetical protein
MSVWLRRAAAVVLGLALASLPFLHARYGVAGHDHHHHAGEPPRPDGAASKGVVHAYRTR